MEENLWFKKNKKTPFIVYAHKESLLEKIDTCHNNPEQSSTTKTNKGIAYGYSLLMRCLLDSAKKQAWLL